MSMRDHTQARFGYPRGLTLDSEWNIILADTENHQIRKTERHISHNTDTSYKVIMTAYNVPAYAISNRA